MMSYLGGGSSGCSGCSTNFEFNNNNYNVMFDENGNLYKAVAKRMFYEPDISEEIVINSDMTISDKLFYENGNVAVDITCDFNNAGRCLGYSELGSYDDTSRSNYEDGIAYTEYFDAVYPEQLAESSNPLYGKNIKATSYYQNGKVAFKFEQKADGTITHTRYNKKNQVITTIEGNIKEGKYCVIEYDDERNPSYEGNSCNQ